MLRMCLGLVACGLSLFLSGCGPIAKLIAKKVASETPVVSKPVVVVSKSADSVAARTIPNSPIPDSILARIGKEGAKQGLGAILKQPRWSFESTDAGPRYSPICLCDFTEFSTRYPTILSLERNGPSDLAGLRHGDILIRFNENDLDRDSTSIPGLIHLILTTPEEAPKINRIEISRNGLRMSIRVIVHAGESLGITYSKPSEMEKDSPILLRDLQALID